MTKTGLLTLIHADNYGALLQAYALQQTLRECGHESLFLNFRTAPDAPERDLSALPPVMRRKIEETMKYHRIRASHFARFRENRLAITPPLLPQDAAALNESMERFIAGSDQIWNFGLTGGDLLYTLPFAAPEKRFSYAASFGGAEGLGKASERFWQELSRFRKISLREADGLECCFRKTGIRAECHLDPCFLQSKEQWLELIRDEPVQPEKYVFLFLIEYDADFCRLAREFAEAKNLPLKVVTASYLPQFGFECFAGTGVTRYLSLIRDAEFVFCDSFHAAVFSILLKKKFMPNLSKAKLAGRSSRLTGLLDAFQLFPDRMNESADWRRIGEKIRQEKARSLEYLNRIYD